jgi:hypothetical protein
VLRQLDTATNWGRYAEIFDYDRESGKLTLTEAAPNEAAEHAVKTQNPAPTPKV